MSEASPDLSVIRLEQSVYLFVSCYVYEVICLLLLAFVLLAVINLFLIGSLLTLQLRWSL